MFDIGFAELLLVGVLALLILGPERFPACARTLGAWLGYLRRSMEELRTELEELDQPSSIANIADLAEPEQDTQQPDPGAAAQQDNSVEQKLAASPTAVQDAQHNNSP